MTTSDDLGVFAAGIPLVDDRVLLEMVEGLAVADDLTRFRRGQSRFARLMSSLSGRDWERRLLTTQNILDTQHGVVAWLTETVAQGALTNLVVARVAHHLEAVGQMALKAETRSLRTEGDLRELAALVGELAEECRRAFTGIRQVVDELGRRTSAVQEFMGVTASWEAGRRGSGLPWLVRCVLLPRELASGSCGLAEHADGDRTHRRRIDDWLVAGSKGRPRRVILPDLLDQTAAELGDPERRELVAAVLESGLGADLGLPAGPVVTALTTTLEMASLRRHVRPARPGHLGWEIAHRRFPGLRSAYELDRLVTFAVDEQFDAALLARVRAEVRSP
ncbi:hypothetical protein ACFOY4_09830 [Actinomadura syzygii]|uniref:Uncharacterized protein n=1 Tax=Actinomadura syzygii TaxID=1427538 RepID=A0A5D0UDZ8_9ACTN|nr:hypothetical protein [Actinomadura syzygii]TYC15882.1 hypothetical protein FXF65_11110 [Actinomadura syzygii]